MIKKKHSLGIFFVIVLSSLCILASCKDNPPVVEKDYDSYVLPKGATGDIPAWTKTDSTYSIPDLSLHGEASNITPELKAALADAVEKGNFFKKPKNYIVMVGDGMGISQILAASKYRGELLMNELPYRAVANSWLRGASDFRSTVTDSGAGGTKIATGYRTTKLFVSMDVEGDELMSLSELARSKGKKIGVVTNAELADATPADFSVHSKNRSQGWNKICQMQVLFGADLFMGGSDSSLTDAIARLSPLSGETIKKYTTFAKAISAIDSPDLMWNLFSGGDTTYARWDSTSTKYPSLQQAMALSLTRLQKISGEEGFFLMFENTYTDIYGHANDEFMDTTKVSKNVVGIVNEVKNFDETVAIALKFVLENPDTVLLITADHETGNMQFKTNWEEKEINKGITASSGSHSTQNVPIFAIGYGLESIDTKKGEAFTIEDCKLLDGTDGRKVHDNTICAQILGSLMNEKEDSFGGDIDVDVKDNSQRLQKKIDRDIFNICRKDGTPSSKDFNFTINENTLPIKKSDLIQFKINPDVFETITITDSTGNKLLDNVKLADCKNAKIETDSKGNVITQVSQAYKFAFNDDSEKMENWYQISVKAAANTDSLNVSLSKSGDVVDSVCVAFDDFTVQYGSTRGYVTITGDDIKAENIKDNINP